MCIKVGDCPQLTDGEEEAMERRLHGDKDAEERKAEEPTATEDQQERAGQRKSDV